MLATVDPDRHPRVLEVGCGTGKWLADLASAGCRVAGVDPSVEMLRRAATGARGNLCRGSAETLPWRDRSFDAVFYINAFHHFAAPERALAEAFRILRPGGKLLSIGLDPHEGAGRWYVYDFFAGTLALDLARFHSRARRTGWMEVAGFRDVAIQVAERMRSSRSLEDAVRDGVLERTFTSQLVAISPEEYSAGMERIRCAALQDAEFRLEVDITIYATEARKPL